ncbi:MAG: sodium:alanine symporter family protein [Erysipelotrichaceae bacterium]
MQELEHILNKIDSIVWGLPLIILLVGTGIYFTYKLRFIQIRKLKLAFISIFKKEANNDNLQGEVSSFGALCTALSSTIGTGNIVGVATAIVAGGPGAIFWMWIAAFFGMATKYAEGVLAIKYRIKDANGETTGGPMYYLELGLHNKLLAKAFAFFGVCVALLGIGTFGQVKSISDAAYNVMNIPAFICAIVLVILVGCITIGGIKRISKVAEFLIPLMSILYIGGVLIVLITHITLLPDTIAYIIECAFNPSAAFGGTLGIGIVAVMQKGIGRGVFSNEAGLGSAPIAAAAAKTDSPVRQGLISMTGTFIDTIVICTMTGLALVISGAYTSGLNGAAMTSLAFEQSFFIPSIGTFIVNIGLIFFAFTTIIGWNYYGERCIQYLAGVKAIIPYKIIFLLFVGIGPFLSLDLIFIIADIVNALMAVPNLIGLIGLRHIVIEETRNYFLINKYL